MQQELQFKISSGLKDIIGRDLITDDFIAMFELVKNSYDAHATSVDIYFENIYSSGGGKIRIVDDGKGMSFDDLKNKWLFVAYSAKKAGTEDDSFDYRDSIQHKRTFAGAKGIGRFSCDRLGRQLFLETTKHGQNSKTEVLVTDWGKFESDINKEFIDISVLHETKDSSDFGLSHGTVLEITELRNEWDRNKLLKLKDSLAKLISPSKDRGATDFKIIIHVEEEISNDDDATEDFEKVNGEVQNFIFETLGLKTTKIYSTISSDGKFITTELTDGGTKIYRIKEKNTFQFLDSIDINLYYLNMSAKLTFTRRMGLSSNQYGHVFLYKNGFRIYPYGEPGEDPLKLDVRKAQGYRRHLGTRELIGQIEIFSFSDLIKETSSRGDGLIKTKAYYQLEDFFWETLKRLERYVVDVQQWGLSVEDESSFDLKSRVGSLLAKLTDSSEIVDFETADNFFEILELSKVDSAETIAKNLNKLAIDSGDQRLIELTSKTFDKLTALQAAREEAEKHAELEFERAEKATEKLKEQISENLFLKSINTSEYQEVIALLHHIGIYAGTVDNSLKGISLRIQNEIPLSKEDLNTIIRTISFEIKKILNVVAFATKANFKLKTEEIDVDLKNYIKGYIQEIVPSIADKSLTIKIEELDNSPFIRKVKPIEVNIVIDNLINNAKKAKATEIKVVIDQNSENNLKIDFIDNGIGIDRESIERIYDFGFTTTDGSGLGLYHVKEIMESVKGSITASNNESEGATFSIVFK